MEASSSLRSVLSQVFARDAAMDVRITVKTTFNIGKKRIHQLGGIGKPYRATCAEVFGGALAKQLMK